MRPAFSDLIEAHYLPAFTDRNRNRGSRRPEVTNAGLDASAREATKAPSQGTYQFSFFRIVSDTHRSTYEVHFNSNDEGAKDT